ncbi:beta-1,3-glucan-binding protein-like isoform X2 [Pectinophora gossypiella]|uniref:beta-1,3-glucan-binding protein-like isoform X2 n=1 Tax=Pectinophora gossypiella TaxID=13191 RepID=UPI00214EEE72|nr:beta-1,3-glucan-binding protein-like isoform X2 [Pectinophora gossypiella]
MPIIIMWPVVYIALLAPTSLACMVSETTVSGTHAPATFCSGDLIFSDDFQEFDLEKWQHENTLAGGGNWEFQYYNNNRTNSFTHDGLLFIRPSLTSDQFGEEFLSSGTLNIEGGAPADRCTNPINYGCERTGTPSHVLNPVKSARVRTVNSFNFRYGRVEVRAKLPAGDWLWPAIWLMPAFNVYGSWPSSGEIDLVESRGNRKLYQNNVNIGTEQVGSTLHFGPYWGMNAYESATWSRHNNSGYDNDFHRYQLEWTSDHIKFSIDDEQLGYISPDAGGFWHHGGFDKSGLQNPWRYGSKMAPFDQKFYIIMNLAVGGTNGYFPDDASNPAPKPWPNNSPQAITDFWSKKSDWLPTWNLDTDDGKDASLQVDYVKVWAL